jgi:hypothetical protein
MQQAPPRPPAPPIPVSFQPPPAEKAPQAAHVVHVAGAGSGSEVVDIRRVGHGLYHVKTKDGAEAEVDDAQLDHTTGQGASSHIGRQGRYCGEGDREGSGSVSASAGHYSSCRGARNTYGRAFEQALKISAESTPAEVPSSSTGPAATASVAQGERESISRTSDAPAAVQPTIVTDPNATDATGTRESISRSSDAMVAA